MQRGKETLGSERENAVLVGCAGKISEVGGSAESGVMRVPGERGCQYSRAAVPARGRCVTPDGEHRG